MINEVHTANGKNVADVLRDFKNEIIILVATRFEMLQEEMKQKTSAIKAAVPMIVAGMMFLLAALLTLTGAFVALIAAALPGNPWAYAISFGVVTVLYGIIGGIVFLTGKNALSKQSLSPDKTLQVLHEDRVWLEGEARRVA